MSRCHSAMADEFEDSKQRHAVCMGAWRKAKGGKKPKASASTAPAAGRLMSVFNVAQDFDLRREELDGHEHVVLPLIALVEGVYQCANCPAPNFYPASEFGKNPGAWNGRPVTIGHPERDGAYVSAGSPDVWANERIGTLFNARRDGDKLRVEAWIDPAMVERAGADAQAVMDAITDGQQVEVSTAAWIDEQPRFGSHRGRKYEAVQINFQPDHTALLPLGQIGACSWADGCGVRVAQARLDGSCCDACARGEECACDEHGQDPAAQQTARSLETALQMAVSDRFGDAHVADWDEGHVYFFQFGGDQPGMQRVGYSEDDDGNVVLGETPERVRPRQEFVVVNQQQEDGDMPQDPKNPGQQPAEQPKPKPQPTPTPGDDGDDQQPTQTPGVPKDDRPKNQLSAEQRKIAELEAENEHLKAAQRAQPKPQTVEDWIASAPAEMQPGLIQMHKDQHRKRLVLIDKIKAARGNVYSDQDLAGMDTENLEKVAAIAAGQSDFGADYSIQPADLRRRAAASDEDYVPAPTSPWDKPKGAATN